MNYCSGKFVCDGVYSPEKYLNKDPPKIEMGEKCSEHARLVLSCIPTDNTEV